MRYDIHSRTLGDLRRDVREESGRAVLDRAARRDGGGYHGAAGCGERGGDAVPVVEGREVGQGLKRGEAEEAMGEDNGMFWSCCMAVS